jgi:hypothetical protein
MRCVRQKGSELCGSAPVASRYVPAAGDIVWLRFTPQAGHEQAGVRAALVGSPAACNSKTSRMLCCPMITEIKDYPFEVHIGTSRTGAVLADQVNRQGIYFFRPGLNRIVSRKTMVLKSISFSAARA